MRRIKMQDPISQLHFGNMSKILITRDSLSYLPKIKQLWRRNSETLGFFPEGAFEDHSKKRLILVAHSEDNQLLGYLLFRFSRGTTVIVHLCVNPTSRSKGIAKQLVQKLKEVCSESRGISLKCRRDINCQVSGLLWALSHLERQPAGEETLHPLPTGGWTLDIQTFFRPQSEAILLGNSV